MRKSIYYLIANIVSTITLAFFIGIVGNNCPVIDLFNSPLIVKEFTSSIWEPMKFALPVLTLSIIVTTRDVVIHKENQTSSILDKVLTLITAICTIIMIGYTWSSAILAFDGYVVGKEVSLPIAFIISYVIALIMMFLSSTIAKKNQNLALSFVLTAIILIIASLVYECLDAYLIAGIICYAVVLVAFIISLILSLKKAK